MAKNKHTPRSKHQLKPKQTRRLTLISLGCAKNRVDSEVLLGTLLSADWDLAVDPLDSDLTIINTCGFLADARQEAEDIIEELIDNQDINNNPKIVVVGCYAQRFPQLLRQRYPAIDAVLPFASYEHIVSILDQVMQGDQPTPAASDPSLVPPLAGSRLLTTGVSAYLRIAEGCNNRCAYCAIPLIRGKFRCRAPDAIIQDAHELLDLGVEEICLVAQDITRYNYNLITKRSETQVDLTKLLEQLLSETDATWIRLLYAHPAHLSDSVIQLLATEKRLCNYLDLPIQHIDNNVLTAMNRHINEVELRTLLERLRSKVPDLILRTTLLVGFPGETEAAFNKLLSLVEDGAFQHLGVFTYSPEAGTPAATFDQQIDAKLAQERSEQLMLAQQKHAFAWRDAYTTNKTPFEVLITDVDTTGIAIGRSQAEAPEVDGNVLITNNSVIDKQLNNAKKTQKQQKRSKSEQVFVPGMRIMALQTGRNGYDRLAKPVN